MLDKLVSKAKNIAYQVGRKLPTVYGIARKGFNIGIDVGQKIADVANSQLFQEAKDFLPQPLRKTVEVATRGINYGLDVAKKLNQSLDRGEDIYKTVKTTMKSVELPKKEIIKPLEKMEFEMKSDPRLPIGMPATKGIISINKPLQAPQGYQMTF